MNAQKQISFYHTLGFAIMGVGEAIEYLEETNHDRMQLQVIAEDLKKIQERYKNLLDSFE